MNEECPNCRQITNTSFSRLIKDTCGHTKCRMCLLYEEQGCKTCNNEHHIQNIGNYDCSTSTKEVTKDITINSDSNIGNNEVLFPLELVINKESKPKTNCLELVFADRLNETEIRNEDIFNDRGDTYNTTTTNDNENICSKLYIPKIEPSDVASSIRTCLNENGNKITELQTSYSTITTDNKNLEIQTEGLDKEKSLKSKTIRYPDRSHISVIPGTPEKYKCNICNKIFRNKKGKCYHDACITGIRPYQCTFCDKSFVKRSHFEYHERVHRGYKPFKCSLCDKAFPQRNKLNRHMYSHSTEKQFVCSICNKGYTKRDDLKNHLNLHNSTATYSCKTCDKTFRILANLKRHMRTHTNERPHGCDQCNKTFKDKSLLVRHKRTHGKERPFACAHCNRVFLCKSELRRHLAVHSEEKPYSCEYCQTVFRRKDNLNRHIRHHHTQDSSFDAKKMQVTVVSTKLAKIKQTSPKHKQRSKKTPKMTANSLPKSPAKVSVVYVNSRDQINSRLDSMGNITPVIRTTSELSNAVPVINGPISIKKPEDKNDTRKKTFNYTEPIPPSEAVVINRRIEEKLYPQNISNHNYFYRNCLNCTDKPYPTLASQTLRVSSRTKVSTNKTLFCENSTTEADLRTSFTFQNVESIECSNSSILEKQIYMKSSIDSEAKSDDRISANSCNGQTANLGDGGSELKRNNSFLTSVKQKQTNCTSSIKKHIIHQFESEISGESSTTDYAAMAKKIEDFREKKQSNVHWRRRTAETLKPSNQ